MKMCTETGLVLYETPKCIHEKIKPRRVHKRAAIMNIYLASGKSWNSVARIGEIFRDTMSRKETSRPSLFASVLETIKYFDRITISLSQNTPEERCAKVQI